jgi:acid phosphatase (class A)
MIRAFLIASTLMTVGGAAALAQISPQGAPPARSILHILTQQDIDPGRLIPPPPAAGSAAEKAELAELHEIQEHRTGGQFDQAVWDDTHEDWRLFTGVLGLKFDMAQLPATAKVLEEVMNDGEIAATRAKDFFKRPRPWKADSTIRGCAYKPSANPLTSYPSGHTIVGFSLGVVLADLMPDKADTILQRAQEYGYSRLVCGLHYRSDTAASQALGTTLAVEMLHSAKMQADLAAARAELKAAGLTAG